jgi:MFS family permease/quinol monooxygenase YgiN
MVPSRPAMSPSPARPPTSGSAFAPLQRPVFRALWGALIVSALGSWMHDVGAGWLMTSLAPEPFMVAMVQSAAQLPMFLLTLPAGALADIVDRRRYLIATQFVMMTAALALGALTLTGLITPPLLILFTFVMGSGAALMMPAFSAVIPELVPREELTAAITLNSIAFNAMRAVGPAVAGLILALTGPGIVFLGNAVTLTAVVWALSRWRSETPATNLPAERFTSSIRTGLRYVRQSKALHAILLRGVALLIPMGAPLAFLPLVVRTELNQGPEVYGLLLGSVGAGAVFAGLQLARLRAAIPADNIIRGGTVGVVIASLALGWVREVWLLSAAMFLLGGSWISAQSTLQVTTQLSLPAWVRARGLAVFIASFMGVLALGAPAWGKLAQHTSLQVALTAAATVGILGLLATWRLSLNLHTRADTTLAEPARLPELPEGLAAGDGPVLVNVTYQVPERERDEFLRVMREEVRRVRLRNGSSAWGVFLDPATPDRYVEVFLDESWEAHLRQHYRVTRDDRRVLDRAAAHHRGDGPPVMSYLLSPAQPPRRWRPVEPGGEGNG